MLYYSGALLEPGEVHDGNTVMDYMQQERDRGITIRSAAISFNWNGHQFNLIDTPGHIDFTGEVERSLRVLDGAIAIFDGVSGVQVKKQNKKKINLNKKTQSEMVWSQSNKFNIPRLAFINKMDRNGANLESTLDSIQTKLCVDPLVLQYPIGDSDQFKGVVDLISMKKIIWADLLGNVVKFSDLEKSDGKLYTSSMEYREKLLETIMLYDEEIDNIESLSQQQLEQSIKRILLKYPKDCCAILIGSSLKNKGIQPLMDAIIKYLPQPEELGPVKCAKQPDLLRQVKHQEKLSAYVYKIVNDQQKGALTYFRVYSGSIQNKQQIIYSQTGTKEKVMQLLRVRADNYVAVNQISAGDIGAIQGLKQSKSGYTILDSKDGENFTLEQLQMPQPVFMASLEYQSLKDKIPLQNALEQICREDNSLQYVDDENLGQIIVKGLGELHLEILRDRLQTEYNLDTKLGKMRVQYKESISDSYEIIYKYEKMIKGKPNFFELSLKIEPNFFDEEESSDKFNQQNELNKIEYGFKRDIEWDINYKEYKRRLVEKQLKKLELDDQQNEQRVNENKTFAQLQLEKLKYIKNPEKPVEIEKIIDEYGEDSLFQLSGLDFDLFHLMETTIQNGLLSGTLMSYPLVDCKVTILGGKFSSKRTTELGIQMCTGELMQDLINNANPQLLEPVMDLEVSTPFEFERQIINDISSNKRGRVNELIEENKMFGLQSSQSTRTLIKAVVPLVETVGYSTYLRSISKGEAHFLMKFKKFEFVGGLRQKEIINGCTI
ncbi:hypothetical protein IMG5_164730 [Ichthyophthirius multifiliis]|uniref:Tr-type G domain-containing protein n=1 Tax=Ichthyophthirius multifiliis TaxID=5932 RepID=G0R0I9_ICHMU|nr:hypothetical protein IMG5_164730 [Ichthyophthirius multifiliis]EGR29014.1 hypothetical protein IMG5_164730 [Ichthyophthirius multifiliis]|eukprot:XP_004030250.1 hypothetical protein IMG5_164730 [Ichthyophthirius multifiliis]